MSKEFYLRTCTECHKAFYTEQQKKRLCPDCIKAHRKACSEASNRSCKKPYPRRYIPHKAPHKPKFSITDICRVQDKYYQKHKVWLSYGKTVEMLEKGEIGYD